MVVEEFLTRVREHPTLELVYNDPTMCIVRCTEAGQERRIRLGLWAVRRMPWERIVAAFRLPAGADG
jgi:hypothetical protein